MPSATLKVPTLKSDDIATQLKETISKIKGVTNVQADPNTHNVIVSYNEGPEGTSLSAIDYALSLSKHPRAAFSAGSRKRGFV